jgi:3-hydroxyisobutyrate dehydrogenase-like beta-hydroxyacid dehydrogenase
VADVAFLGFGELGSALAGRLGRTGHAVRAWSRAPCDAAGVEALRARRSAAGVRPAASVREAVSGAAAVLVTAPAGAAEALAAEAGPHLDGDALYADLSAAPPPTKRAGAARLAERGVRYVDVAVLGTVAVSGWATPMLASGEGAVAFRELVAGLDVRAIDAPAGDAALVKLLRSVYMKGRDALVAEMLLGARRYGLEDVLLESIGGPGEQVPFRALSDRVMTGLAVHAGRRAEELASSVEVLREAGVDPIATEAGAARLRTLAELGLREAFRGQRPENARAVLDAIEERSGGAGVDA